MTCNDCDDATGECQHEWERTAYAEAIRIANAETMMLPERRHLLAVVSELERLRSEVLQATDRLEILLDVLRQQREAPWRRLRSNSGT